MLFWLFVIIFAIGVACYTIGLVLYEHTEYDTEWLENVGGTMMALFGLLILFSILVLSFMRIGIDAEVAENHERYKALTYQLENNLYDNDNDIGKKQLYDEIREWNEDLAYHKSVQDDFWLGIFYPNVYDQFEFIDYGGGQ